MVPAVGSAVFDTQEGKVAGPLRVGDSHFLISVEEIRRAELNETTEEVIREFLFSDWVDEEAGKPSFDPSGLLNLTSSEELR